MKYYIPFQNSLGKKVFLELNGSEARVVRGTPDPFSRVASPGLRPGWDEDLGFYLTRAEKQQIEDARVAYTRVWQK